MTEHTEDQQGLDWPEPQGLEDMALDPDVRQRIAGFLERGTLPDHLILHGPPGTGKTTLAKLLAQQVYGGKVVRVVKASETGNVEYIRSSVIYSMKLCLGRRLIIFSEASGLSAEAQDALRDPLEDYADDVRVIFTTNDLNKLSAPLRSRCEVLEIARPPVEECTRVLGRRLAALGVVVDPAEVQAFTHIHFAPSGSDMRSFWRAARRSVALSGTLQITEAGTAATRGEMWPEAVDGAELLDELASVFSTYLTLTEGGAETLALWVTFAHAHESFSYSPILLAISPAMRSGKTRLFEVLSLLTPRALFTSNITAAAIYRLGGLVREDEADQVRLPGPPVLTLCADEGDTWLKLRPELQGVINSGHTRRGAFTIRVARDQPTRFSTWFPKALALINRSTTELPPTVLDRSIVIPMQRRRSDETIAPFRSDEPPEEFTVLRRKAARWTVDNFFRLREADPQMPEQLEDRTKDNWRPLLGIASLAGGRWPAAGRGACLILSGVVDETGELTVLLLGDIRDLFATDPEHPDRLPTRVLVANLRAIDDRPWSEWLTAFKLALMLKPFHIRSKALWTAAGGDQKRTLRGYFLRDFADAFSRYLRGGDETPV